MFRRMVFNVLTDNKDDHVKNFSFICRAGSWSLAPAYDLTRCSNSYKGEHATSVNNNGNPTIEDMLVESIRIKKRKQISSGALPENVWKFYRLIIFHSLRRYDIWNLIAQGTKIV